MVTLGGVDLGNFGIVPVQNGNGNIPISGCWDLPSRIGKTFHDWGDQDGVQPYVRADEIRFGGRDITLSAVIAGEYENQALRKLYSFYDFLGTLTGLATLSTDYGSFQVLQKDEIKAEYYHQGIIKLQMSFREPEITFSGTIPAQDNANFGIDGISFQTLGLKVLDVEGRHNLPSTKQQQFTAYSKEGYQITKRNAREIGLKCIILGTSLSDFETKIKSLQKLFSKEGLRTITYRHDALREFFVKDGFQVSDVYVESGRVFGVLNVRCVQVGQTLDWDFLTTNSGEPILTASGAYIYVDNSQSNRDYNYLTDSNNNFFTTSNGMLIRANDL
jgi:hypothetical protein